MGFPTELGHRGPIECLSTLGRELRVCAHEYKCLTGQGPQSAGLYGGLQVLKQSLIRSLEAIEELLAGEERRALTVAGQHHEDQAPPLRRPASSREAPPDSERIRTAILACLSDGESRYARGQLARQLRQQRGIKAKLSALSFQLQELRREKRIQSYPDRSWGIATSGAPERGHVPPGQAH